MNFSYYGLSLDVSRLGLDMYQMQLLFGAVEVPSKLLVDLLVRHVGHCLVQAGMLLGTTLALGSSLLVTTGSLTQRPRLLCQEHSPLHSTRGTSHSGSSGSRTRPAHYLNPFFLQRCGPGAPL